MKVCISMYREHVLLLWACSYCVFVRLTCLEVQMQTHHSWSKFMKKLQNLFFIFNNQFISIICMET